MSRPQKSYKNLEFLNSAAARHIRILAEYEDPRQRFIQQELKDTIVMFGSARIPSREDALARLDAARAAAAAATDEAAHDEANAGLMRAAQQLRMSRYYEDARELSRRLTEWSMQQTSGRRYVMCTGGGPGIMEAGNRGAADVPGGRSVGLAISLPFEEGVNQYVTPELGFEFHYFFMRKYWFMYLAKAMIVMPGGFGTLDEFTELLTLRQTGKIRKPMPTVLFGKEYWTDVINVQAMVDWGTISAKDLNLFHVSDSVDDAFDFLVSELERIEQTGPTAKK
ncbi:LOG family protein [Myxococcota bacterium]|nr:LOG family protein [Myxococcota bacterium]